ncbi:hypothetical protein GCM10010515_52730 [Streptomyces fructofermentans]|uniref:Uncharacterized protein n=1 Tax=Streptomyces fructofermentans TaxID=152141 RepID=A0A918NLB0_9ACTN|nr:hypothetical protein GCM10010515_52730 [Streptomyces fructofermentans]
MACAANALAHVAAHLAEADETELHQVVPSLATWQDGTFVPAYEPKPGRSRTSVGTAAQTYGPTCGFGQPLSRTGMIRYL